MLKIIVDCMSGECPPEEAVKGAVAGAVECGAALILVGDEAQIRSALRAEEPSIAIAKENITVIDAPGAPVTMNDDPSCVIKQKRDASMPMALRLLAEGKGDAVVSAGNTGALFVGATLIVKRIRGMRRAALGAIVPLGKPILIVDAGANTDAQPEHLLDFALLGNLYMKKVALLKSPKVGLINNGAEEKKGTELYVETHRLLKEADRRAELRFIGNIEGRDLPAGKADIVVCDGFTGNIVLKLCEGFGLFIKKTLTDMFYSSLKAKLGAVFVMNNVKALKKKMDYSEHGGAPFLGIAKPVIKAHGSSGAKSIRACVIQAKNYAASNIIGEFEALLKKREEQAEEKDSAFVKEKHES